jgi:allantoinase
MAITTVALNSEVCDHQPEIIERAMQLDWELMGHGQTNVRRINEMSSEQERDAIFATVERIERACGKRQRGRLGPSLAGTWQTLKHLSAAGIRYICDWVNDDQPYTMQLGSPPVVSIPYPCKPMMCLHTLT